MDEAAYAIEPNCDQLAILHHTLGVTPERREPYRNHYLSGPKHYAMPDLDALVAAGCMARRSPPKFCRPDDVVFYVTEAGRTYALENLPPPPKLTRYNEYLSASCFDSFAEFLGINKPSVRSRFINGRWEYQMARAATRTENAVTGEWKPTKKEAKASYKEALEKRRDFIKSARRNKGGK